MSLDDIHKDWGKRAFESESEHIYEVNGLNDMNWINDEGVNNIY